MFKVRILSPAWLLLPAVMLGLVSCSAGSEPDDDDDDPQPPGQMVVSGISPANPWLDEPLIINGSGFGTDVSRYIISIVDCEPAGCTVSAPKVTAASATQLTVDQKSPPGTAILRRGKVRVNWRNDDGTFTSVTYGQVITFRVPPSIRLEDNYDYPFSPPVVRGGDLLSFIVQGYFPLETPGAISIAGHDAQIIEPNDPAEEPEYRSKELEPLTGTWQLFVRADAWVLGPGPVAEPLAQGNVDVSFTGNGGRTFTRQIRAILAPEYTVDGASPATLDKSDGDLLTITGTNMPGQIIVRWYTGSDYVTSNASGCTGACNSVTAPIPAELAAGSHEVVAHLSIFTQETVAALGTVTVVE
jgi:hypothetical protein